MGLFDLFKKKKKSENRLQRSSSNPNSEHYIKEKQLILNDSNKSLEERNAAYLDIRQEEERRLNLAYDFNSIEGINRIPVPCREVNGSSSTGRVEYYLRGQCFARHWDSGNIELALACLKKAQELMYISDMIWKKDDFMRLVYYLRKAGKNQEADIEERKINSYFESKNELRDSFSQRLKSAKELHTDLVEITNSGICCAECAKYRHRIYSISGKDKRFPALPAQFNPKTFSYNHFCLSVWPFVYGVMEPSFECKDFIRYSNRPFVDDRTSEEINNYIKWQMAEQQKLERQEKLRQEAQENAERIEALRKEFLWIQKNLPDLCPKSLSGYSRMKNAKSKSYQKIIQEIHRLMNAEK